MAAVTVSFSHPTIGTLEIDNGLDQCRWAYGLNTAVFPTYGGEVVQILSVYIDDLSLKGTCATYDQAQAIYQFFGTYMTIATQGRKPSPQQANKNSISGSAYNLLPITFTYSQRGWRFLIYPKEAPGFRQSREIVTPTWEMRAFVIDDSPDLDLIKNGIQSKNPQGVQNTSGPLTTTPTQGVFNLNGEISPLQGNPDTDPWQTYTSGIAQQQQVIQKYSDYYNSLLPAYQSGDFSAITGAIGSQPNFGLNSPSSTNSGSTTTVPGKPTGFHNPFPFSPTQVPVPSPPPKTSIVP